ncbi:MAG: 30S ribosomal protein S9 [Planctomycetota bacterium]|jgi:small subunit ribosomal protein S9
MSDDLTPTIDPGATDTPEAASASLAAPDEPKNGYWWGTGRRKAAVARVRIKPGEGKFLVNGREVDSYFTEIQHRTQAVEALKVTQSEGKFDVYANIQGGGYTGQAGALVMGLARALKGYDPAMEAVLRENSLLTRDARRVERKKYGQPGARRRFQFSKR